MRTAKIGPDLRLPNATIYSLTETAPLIERIRLRQLSFHGHMLRLPENEPVREFAMYVPTHGRKKSGRQRTLARLACIKPAVKCSLK